MTEAATDAWYEVQYFGANGWVRWETGFPYTKEETGKSRTTARTSANRTARNLADLGGAVSLQIRVIHCTVQRLYGKES